jgi:hypothetical protein
LPLRRREVRQRPPSDLRVNVNGRLSSHIHLVRRVEVGLDR